jgi:hypothetical protein
MNVLMGVIVPRRLAWPVVWLVLPQAPRPATAQWN